MASLQFYDRCNTQREATKATMTTKKCLDCKYEAKYLGG